MLRITLILIASFLWCAHPVCAQSNNPRPNPSLNNITPPSPNAASLGKFGDVPVGYSTGIPQVTVPIYSYSNADKSLTMNISLDYHAGGVKVDEVASNVGLGFALNAGGVITRTQRGIADELPDYGFLNTPPVPDEREGNRMMANLINAYTRMDANDLDGQSDIFNYNLNGRSGKFMFGKNGDFLMLSLDPVVVEKTLGANPMNNTNYPNFKSFTITDEHGVKYIFEALEVTSHAMQYSIWHSFVSAWYLTKIIAPFSTDAITLEYEDEKYEYTQSLSASETLGLDGFPSTQSSGAYTVTILGKRIKKITYPNQVVVDFTYDDAHQRQDLPQIALGYGLYRLKDISITDGVNTRGFHLYHDYSLNRLTLLKVLPYDSKGETQGYMFDYYKKDSRVPNPLPPRLDFNQDHWGFYNTNYADHRPGGLIPWEYYKDAKGPFHNKLPGGNREVDLERVKYGSLFKMTYPTQGYTEFDMEANVADDWRLKQAIVWKNEPHPESISIYAETNAPRSESFMFNGDPNTTTEFTLTSNPGSYDCTRGDGLCYIVVEILKPGGDAFTNAMQIALDGGLDIKHEFSLYGLIPGTQYSCRITVDGATRFGAYFTLTWIPVRDANPDYSYFDVIKPNVGGLRIKTIRHYDGINPQPVLTKEYDYLEEDGVTSSGGLGVYPVYTRNMYYDWRAACWPWPIDGYQTYFNNSGAPNVMIRSTSTIQALAMTNGSPVNYARVVESITAKGKSNGSIVRYFTSYKDSPLPVQVDFPFTPPDYAIYGYGQLEKEIVLNTTGDTVSVTQNDYWISQDDYYTSPQRFNNFKSISVAPAKMMIEDLSCDGNPNTGFTLSQFWERVVRPVYFLSNSFTPVTGRKDLVKTLKTEYRDGGKFKTETTYVYDRYFNVKETVTRNSKNEAVSERLYYPHEYSTALASTLVTNNMVATAIAMDHCKTKGTNKYLIGGWVNQFQAFGGAVRKSGTAIFEGTTPVAFTAVPEFNGAAFNRAPDLFKERLLFTKYNASGFIAEQSKKNNTPHSIIWDYKLQYPVAEVNALSADIAFTSFEADADGYWIIPNAERNLTDAKTGRKCYNLAWGILSRKDLSISRTYIVSYWSKNGSYALGGGSVLKTTTGNSINGWTYYEHTVTASSATLTISGSGLIDEVRLYPQGAQMTTYTYDILYGMSSSTDSNNVTTFYDYDGLGRLEYIKDAYKNILKKYKYNYRQ